MKKFGERIFMISITTIFLLLFYGNVQAADISTLKVVESYPNIGDKIINIDDDITVVFNSNVKNGSKFSDISLRDSNNLRIPITCKIAGAALAISPGKSLDYGKLYTVTIPFNAVMDEERNFLNEDFNLTIVTAGDYISPEIVSMIPADQAKEVDVKNTISIKFSEKVMAGSEIEGIDLLSSSNIKVPFDIGINGDTLTIKPLRELEYNTSYFIFLPADSLVDLSGNGLDRTELKNFTTKCRPGELKINMTKPSRDAKYISINNPIQIFFDESIIGDTALKTVSIRDRNASIPIDVSLNRNILSIFPKNDLNFAYNTTYYVTIPSGAVKGLSGATVKSSYSFSFTTEGQVQDPKILEAVPQNGITDAAIDGQIKVTFSERIKQGQNINSISLKNGKGNSIPIYVTLNDNILTIIPRTLLEYNTSYTYIIPYGSIINYSNIPLKQDYKFEFKTDHERFNPYIYKSFPVNQAFNATVDGGITLIFNEDIQKGENFDFIFLRDASYNELPVTKEITGKTLKIMPVDNLNLAYNTKYVITVPYGAVKDLWNNSFENSTSISFTTGYERFCPIIKLAKPADHASDTKINDPVEITFNDKILKGDNFNDIALMDSENNIIKCTIEVIDDKVVIKPVSNLENNSVYSLFLPVGGVKDYLGGVSKNDFLMNFKTCLEKVPPAVKYITPVNGTVNIDTGTSIAVLFSENIIKGKLFNKITLTNGNMKNVPCTIEIKNNKLTIKPVKPLEEITSYTLRIPCGSITDKSGNQLKEDIITNFSTRAGAANKDALVVNHVSIKTDYSVLAILFNKNVLYGSNIKRLLLKDQSGRSVLMSFGIKGNILSLKPRVKLTHGNRYTLIIPPAAVRDKQGKSMIRQYSYSFIAK